MLALEALLLALPVTILLIPFIVGSFAQLSNPHLETYEAAQIVAYLLPVPSLTAGWILIGRFLRTGASGLRIINPVTWWLVAVGALIPIGALIASSSFDPHKFEYDPTDLGWFLVYFRELALGLPAVIPLLHLLIERLWRAPANSTPGGVGKQ